jgi:uncharacterized protein with HEPN domain
MRNTVQKRLLDAREACRAIQAFVAGCSFGDYEQDLKLRSAVERQFEIIGEALNRAATEEPGLVDLVPEVRRVVALRNRVIHGYDSVDDELLWQACHVHVPRLERLLTDVLAAAKEAPDTC